MPPQRRKKQKFERGFFVPLRSGFAEHLIAFDFARHGARLGVYLRLLFDCDWDGRVEKDTKYVKRLSVDLGVKDDTIRKALDWLEIPTDSDGNPITRQDGSPVHPYIREERDRYGTRWIVIEGWIDPNDELREYMASEASARDFRANADGVAESRTTPTTKEAIREALEREQREQDAREQKRRK